MVERDARKAIDQRAPVVRARADDGDTLSRAAPVHQVGDQIGAGIAVERDALGLGHQGQDLAVAQMDRCAVIERAHLRIAGGAVDQVDIGGDDIAEGPGAHADHPVEQRLAAAAFETEAEEIGGGGHYSRPFISAPRSVRTQPRCGARRMRR